jgi:hypothetical protein
MTNNPTVPTPEAIDDVIFPVAPATLKFWKFACPPVTEVATVSERYACNGAISELGSAVGTVTIPAIELPLTPPITVSDVDINKLLNKRLANPA